MSSQIYPPTPAQVALNYLLLTLYSLAGTLIYYPSFIVNLPESTLEESLPKQDLCVKMGFSKRICKKKIKCLFKNCDYLDDPIGYKLDKQFKKPCNRKRRSRDVTNKNIMVGGKKKTRKYPEKLGWRRCLSKNMKKQLKNEYKTNISNFISNKTKIKRNRRTKKYHGGNNKNILNPDTCKNKKTKLLCSLRNGGVVYPEPLILSETLQKQNELLKLFGGGNQHAAKSAKSEDTDELVKEDTDELVKEDTDELVKEETDLKNPMTPQSNEEKIKSIILEKIKTHNKDLFKVIEKNPGHVNKIIDDFKKKYPIISRTLFRYPKTIEKYSDKLIPFIKNIRVNLTAKPTTSNLNSAFDKKSMKTNNDIKTNTEETNNNITNTEETNKNTKTNTEETNKNKRKANTEETNNSTKTRKNPPQPQASLNVYNPLVPNDKNSMKINNNTKTNTGVKLNKKKKRSMSKLLKQGTHSFKATRNSIVNKIKQGKKWSDKEKPTTTTG